MFIGRLTPDLSVRYWKSENYYNIDFLNRKNEPICIPPDVRIYPVPRPMDPNQSSKELPSIMKCLEEQMKNSPSMRHWVEKIYEANGKPDPNYDTYLVQEGLIVRIQGPGYTVQLEIPERKSVKLDVQSGTHA